VEVYAPPPVVAASGGGGGPSADSIVDADSANRAVGEIP